MVPTMKSDLHENRHENLHGWRKIKEFFRHSKKALGALRFTYEVFWLVKGFISRPLRVNPPPELLQANVAAGARAFRLLSHRRRQSMVAAEYGSPPEIAGHAGAGVGLCGPRSSHGRALTAAASARNRE
jgi:hypothetical protein